MLLFSTARVQAVTNIPIEYRNGMIWLKISIQGKDQQLNFVLDSGAGVNIVDVTVARKLGLRLGRSEVVQGCSGETVAYHLDGFTIRVASFPVNSSFLAMDLSGPNQCCPHHIDGLIGMDFFLNHIVQIDYETQKIRLLQRNEINFAHSETLPLTRCNDALCATVSVANNKPELLRLDTGCRTAIEWVATKDVKKKLNSASVGLNSSCFCNTRADVRLGTVCVPSVRIGMRKTELFPGESGLIGNGLLSRFTVTIDAARKICLLSAR